MNTKRPISEARRGRVDQIGTSYTLLIFGFVALSLNAFSWDRSGAPPLLVGGMLAIPYLLLFILFVRAAFAWNNQVTRTVSRPIILYSLAYFAAFAALEWIGGMFGFPFLHWIQSGLLILIVIGIIQSSKA